MDNSTVDITDNEKRLDELISEYMAMKNERKRTIPELSPNIRRRVSALKNLQMETLLVEAELHRNIYVMEKNFQPRHEEIFKKRLQIIKGLYEPTAIDCKPSGYEDSGFTNFVPTEGQVEQKGIPNFWLNVLRNVNSIRPMIQQHDEEILKHLIDIRSLTQLTPNFSFQLEFHFEPNEFFYNSVLTKTYYMKCELDENEPFTFDGPIIYKTTGCQIMWKDGRNIAEIFPKIDSFFNFFTPPQMKTEGEEACSNDNIEEYIENDFAIGHFLKEQVIPRAVLYFTSEINDFLTNFENPLSAI